MENFDPKQLNIGIWSGDVTLKNLKLKKESLDKLELPIDVHYGFLGQLTLQIPWANLRAKPVKVIIEDVYLLAAPMMMNEYDEEKIKERELSLKKQRIQDLNLIEENKNKLNAMADGENQLSEDQSKKQESFTESLITKVVDNLQITIKNIHLRYEDSSVFTDIPYSFGFTLDELSAVSADGDWIQSFVSLSDSFARKLLTLKSLSCYFNSSTLSFMKGNEDFDEQALIDKFKSLIAKESDDMHASTIFQNNNFLLKPVSGCGKITVNKLGTTESNPHILSELSFKEFAMILNSDQYRDILNTASNYRFYSKTFKFKKYRPAKGVTPKSDPKAWFKYAATVVLNEIHEKNYKWSWDYFKTRRDQRKAYMKYFRLKLISGYDNLVMSKDALDNLDNLENELSYEDIKFYRSIAKAQVRKERINMKNNSSGNSKISDKVEEDNSDNSNLGKLVEKNTKTAPKPSENQGWFSSWWGTTNGTPDNDGSQNSETASDDNQDLIMTEDQKNELFAAIEFDENQALKDAIDIPKDRIKMKLLVSLEKGSFEIKNKSKNISEIAWEGCNFQFFERPDSILSKFTMKELKIEDSEDSKSLYKHIVNIKPMQQNFHDNLADLQSSSESDQMSVEPFFQFSFETNPLDESADSKLTAKLKSMTIFYHASYVEKIVKFFTPPKQHQDTISAIMNAAEATMEGFTNQTKLGLEYALEEHKTVNTQLDLQAPLIILPLDPEDVQSPCGIIDAGHISVVSNLIDKSKADELKKKPNSEFSIGDWNKLNELMYDKFNLHLHDAQILIGPNMKSVIKQLHIDEDNGDLELSPALIMNHFNTDFLLHVSILPRAYTLPKFKFSGNIPSIKAKLSDYQYKVILELFGKLIPDFNESVAYDHEYDSKNENDKNIDPDDDSIIDMLQDNAEFSDALSYISASEGSVDINDTDSSKVESIENKESARSDNTKSSSGKRTQTADSELIDKQHIFDFDFKISLLVLTLLKCTESPFKISVPMVDLVCENFDMVFSKTKNNMDVDIILSDINIIDRIDLGGSEEYKKIISSNNFTKNDRQNYEQNKKTDLVKIKYKRTQRIVEINDELIELYDQNINLDIAAVKGMINRKNLLTIYTFIMTTFTSPNAEETPADVLRHNTEDNTEGAPQMINVTIDLERIIVILLSEEVKLATLQLSSGNMNVLLLPETMKVHFKLGALTLHDEINEGSPRDSITRKLISIDDDDSAEVIYETYDPATNENIYGSKVQFRTGSMRVNLIEEPIRKVLGYLTNFISMKGLFDSARDSNYNKISEVELAYKNENKMNYDILVKTPIIVFPRLHRGSLSNYDAITVYLGEFKASNSFEKCEDIDGAILSKVAASLTSTQLTSEFYLDGGKQFLKIIDGIDMKFDIDNGYTDTKLNLKRASNIINVSMNDTEMKLTEFQLDYLMKLMQTVPTVFQFNPESELLKKAEQEAINASITILPKVSENDSLTKNSTELFQNNQNITGLFEESHLRVNLKFNVGMLSLSIYNNTKEIKQIADLSESRLSRFSLNGISINFKLKEDGNYESILCIRSFTVEDIRVNKDNVFTEIIPPIDEDKYQFMCKIFTEGITDDKYLNLLLTVDSPKMILALDYLFALKDYVFKGLGINTEEKQLSAKSKLEVIEEMPEEASNGEVIETENNNTDVPVSKRKFSYSINVIDFSVILIADPTKKDSEAIVFKLEQLTLSSKNIVDMNANRVGMFLCRMNDFDNSRLRLINDFSGYFSFDDRNSTPNKVVSKIKLSIESLLLRVSLSDIRLVLNIINKAYELSGVGDKVDSATKETENAGYTVFTKEFRKKISKKISSASFHSDFSGASERSVQDIEPVFKVEKLNADFKGFRLVILGDVHELPVLDMNIKPFEVEADNWSTNFDLNTNIESFVNIFNYARSSWEPLIEPWKVSFHVSKNQKIKDDTFNVDIMSRDVSEVTLSSRSITLLSQMYSLVSLNTGVSPRGAMSPYTILNQTGYDINIWIDTGNKSKRSKMILIRQNESSPWEFEDWTVVRENLNVDNNKGSIGVELINSPYKCIESISLIGEGEELFMMVPSIQGVHNRLACSIKLTKENVKQIILKSTITVVNTTGVAISVGFGLSLQNDVNESHDIEAGELFAIPIDRVYSDAIAIKPKIGNNSFRWSSSRIYWKKLYDSSITLECVSGDTNQNSSFYFHISAKKHPGIIKKLYPHLQIIISAPLQIENLLPYNMKYQIYDKNIKRSWSVDLVKGNSSNVHFIDTTHLLLLSVEPLDCGFKKSEFSIINTANDSVFPIDSKLNLVHADNQKMSLNIEYNHSKDKNYIGLKISIYAPYIILNRTGQNLTLGEKYNVLNSIAGSSLKDPSTIKSSQPKMFSFEKDGDRKNRAFLSVGDSDWSRAFSLDAIGQFFDLSMNVHDKGSEINVGVDIKEGEGKYLNTKVVTISPRFIITNDLQEELNINEIGSAKSLFIKPRESIPLNETCFGDEKELRLKFLGNTSKWSSPFSINDIGEVHLKLLKQNSGHILLKIVVLLENATLFIRIEDAKNHWPFSIRNFSNSEFVFYQSNPYIDENGDSIRRDSFKAIFYKIPPKSVMPYTWDYPAGAIKELILRSHGVDKSIQLAEIGNLGTMQLPETKNLDMAAVDINIVADGPTQALVISNSEIENVMDTDVSQTNNGILVNNEAVGNASIDDEKYSTRVIVNFKGLGISLITADMQELCYITFNGLEFKYNESDVYQTIIWNLKWIQIDNQLFGSTYPIVMYPTIVPQSGREIESHPTFHFSVSRVKDDSHGVLYIKYMTLLLQELTIDIDEDFLFTVLDFSKFPFNTEDKKKDVLCEELIELPEPSNVTAGQDIYFEALHLQPTQLNLSFMRTDRVNSAGENKTDSQNALMFFFNILTMAVGNVSDAPIKLNALFIENIRVPIPILLNSIQTHYSQDFLFQVHKILGSADFLGNPVGLFNNISSGVMDIFYEPYQGLIMNDRPQELGIDLAKGGLSFLKKSVFGFSDSFSRFTGSVAKGLSMATMDEDYQQRRLYNLRRNKPKHALVGFKSGASSFFDSITSGVSGIALAPIEGASTDGTAGFFRGIGKGIVGLPTKTAIGFFDLASNVSEGIRNTATTFDSNTIEKVRLPRVISYDGIIRSYSESEAQGQYWLKTANGGEYSNSEKYLAHMVLPGREYVLIITFNSIMLVSIVKLEVKWRIGFEEIRAIVLEPSGIKIKLSGNNSSSFVAIPDDSSKQFLYNRIAIAVNQYNRRCQSIL